MSMDENSLLRLVEEDGDVSLEGDFDDGISINGVVVLPMSRLPEGVALVSDDVMETLLGLVFQHDQTSETQH